MTALDRFMAKVRVDEDGCWAWTGYTDRKGYARFAFQGRNAQAHRVAYEAMVGPIPVGLQIDHLCRNRRCVNPEHLEPVTSSENTRRGDLWKVSSSKTECPSGHPYDEANTYHWRGVRRCRACMAARARRRRRANHA